MLSGNDIIQAASRGFDSKVTTYLSSLSPEQRVKLINHKSENGDTALHIAASKGDINTVRALLKLGVDVNATGYQRETAVHRAASYNETEITRLLLEGGASCKIRDYKDDLPIHVAVLNNAIESLSMIIKHDQSQLDARGRDELTALEIATQANNETAVRKLLSSGSNGSLLNPVTRQSVLHLAAMKNLPGIIRVLLEHNVPVDLKNGGGMTPLQCCANQASPSLLAATELIHHHANVNAGPVPPLYLLATKANQNDPNTLATAEMLVAHRADPDVRINGMTPLEVLHNKYDNLGSDELELYNYLSELQSLGNTSPPRP